MERIRVASLQYFIRPVQTFEQFRDQVEALVERLRLLRNPRFRNKR